MGFIRFRGVLFRPLRHSTSAKHFGNFYTKIFTFQVFWHLIVFDPYVLISKYTFKCDGGFPKWSKGADCKSAAEASQVQILHPPRLSGSVVEHLLGKEEIVSPILT